MRNLLVLVLLAMSALAGCSDNPPADDADGAGPQLVDALAAYDAGAESANIDHLGQWDAGGGTQEIDAWGHYLFVDDDADVQILDVKDPLNVEEVGRFTGLTDIQDIKISDDGDWLFIGNDQEGSSPPLGGVGPLVGGIYVVDVSDKANPELKSYLAVGPRRGPHMVDYFQTADGDELVFGANADISINRFDRATGTLTELARYEADLVSAYNRDPMVFDVYYQGYAHDMFVDQDASGRVNLYVANWDAGLRIADITDPANPVEIGGWNDFPEGHEGNLHTVATERIGDRTITVGAVEVGFAVVGGVAYATNQDRSIVYVWDTTDPANIVLLGTWENPRGLPSDRDLAEGASSSTHNLQLEHGRIYLAHYTMGVFILDISTPDLQEGPGLLAFRDEADDNVWDVILEDGILYASDEVRGIVALHYLPDLVGPGGIDSRA